MTTDLQKIPHRSAELIGQSTADGMVIVSPTAGQVRVLNQLGSSIWQLLDGTHTRQEIEFNLIERFSPEIDPSTIREDLDNFLRELEQRGMVVWTPKIKSR